MKVIIDADHIVYRSAGSCEPTKAKPYLESEQAAIWRAEDIIAGIFLDLNSVDAEFYIGGENNFRKQIWPEYKANRKDARIPTHNEVVREHLVLKYKAEIVNDIETDDRCGIRLVQEGDSGICVSLDKDLLTVPGYHWNFVKRHRRLVSPLEASRNFYKQLVSGDAVDNIPGYDGKFRQPGRKKEDGTYGFPIFLEKLIEPLDEMTDEKQMYDYCVQLYMNGVQEGTQESDYVLKDLHRNARLLYIWRKENDNWQPPGQMQEYTAS
jgi:hypothetical protein